MPRLIVARMGSTAEETEEVADHLVRANLAGHDSHGVGMLPAYVRLLQDGLLVPNQTPHTVLDAGALLVIDARRGFGQRMTADAVRRAIGRARELGACVLALRNASHVGRIGTYGELAASAGCAFTAFVNVADGRDIQAPWACAEPRLGTNPFCAAVPGPDGPALMLDMATTTIAAGKARVAYNKGVPVPDDCLIDAAGQPTNDPDGLHPRPHRRDAVVRPAQGVGPGGDVRDHGRRDRRRAAGRPAGAGRHPQLDAGDGDRSVAAGRSGSDRRTTSRRPRRISARRAWHPGSTRCCCPANPSDVPRRSGRQTGIPVDATTWHDIREAAAKLGITAAEIDRRGRGELARRALDGWPSGLRQRS